MPIRNLKILFALVFALVCAVGANAQSDASSPDGKPAAKEDYPKNIQETFARERIKQEEKDFSEMLDRSEEAAKIGDELYKSYETNQKLTLGDAKKMERLEKLVKKIRDELGSEGDDDAASSALPSFGDALKTIKDASSDLFDALKKQGRFGISVVSVESSNTLLKLVRFVRQKPN